MKFTKFTPIELLLLLAMSMLGLLSAAIGIFGGPPTPHVSGEVEVYQLSDHLNVFLPYITTTSLNYFMVVSSIILVFLGMVTFLNGNPKVRKVWTYLQVPYWALQFLAFVAIGVYPIAGICIGLYFGASIFLALNQSLARD